MAFLARKILNVTATWVWKCLHSRIDGYENTLWSTVLGSLIPLPISSRLAKISKRLPDA
jgi:hypothetical protein